MALQTMQNRYHDFAAKKNAAFLFRKKNQAAFDLYGHLGLKAEGALPLCEDQSQIASFLLSIRCPLFRLSKEQS